MLVKGATGDPAEQGDPAERKSLTQAMLCAIMCYIVPQYILKLYSASGLLHWYMGNHMIAPVSLNQP